MLSRRTTIKPQAMRSHLGEEVTWFSILIPLEFDHQAVFSQHTNGSQENQYKGQQSCQPIFRERNFSHSIFLEKI
jgi:hypothetical protein